MGKFAHLEIIPLDDELPPVNNQQNSFKIVNSELEIEKRMPFISDPTIVPRVQKYLENHADKTNIDIVVMSDDLQRIYKDYARRKRIPFRNSVSKAYAIILNNYGLRENSSEELSDEGELNEESNYIDPMNYQLMNMYNKQILQKPLEDNEFIDISSDDSNAESVVPEDVERNIGIKPTNGASTSQKNPKPLVIICSNKVNKHAENKATLKEGVNNEHEHERERERSTKKRKVEEQDKPVVSSVPKKKKFVATLQEPSVTFKDLGGMDKVLENICKLLLHVRHPEVYRQLGISPPRGFLLHGPPGCGKTLVANAIAGELGIPLLKVAGPELVAGISGESEERIRNLFERAVSSTPCILFIDEVDAITPNREHAQKEMERRIVAQLLNCLDDLNQNENTDRLLVIGTTNRPDAIDPALRRAGRFDREICLGIPDCQSRMQILQVITSKLKLTEDFNFEAIAKYTPGFVGADLMALTREAALVAVNRVFGMLKDIREHEKAVALQKATHELLQKQKEQSEKNGKLKDSTELASKIPNESGEIEVNELSNTSDNAIVVIDDDAKSDKPELPATAPRPLNTEETEKLQKALQLLQPPQTALEELLSWLHTQVPLSKEQLSNLSISMEDFGEALKLVQPSAKREGFATVPDVTWNDIGSLRDIREELQMAILAPVQHSEQFKSLGLITPTGVLLCGPPGCGKTLLAKAIANEAGINFISVKGPELLNMYVGESEKAVRTCFERARNSAPCVIFFDELDSLCPKRSDTREGGVTMRVVNQMLTEMDGVQARLGVYLLAATNRPDIVDPAVLRPGRLDKIIYVGLPSSNDRADILKTITKNGTKPLLSPDVDLELIGKSEECDGYTGADLAALVREAGIQALKEFMAQRNQQAPLIVTTEHFKRAVSKIRPSVSEKDQKHYEKLKKIYSVSSGADGGVEEMEYS